MKTFANLLSSLIVAGWIGAIALLSIQNIKLVSLKFLYFKSIEMPVGIVLAFSVGLGVIGGAIVPPLWQLFEQPRRTRASKKYLEYDEYGREEDLS
ncbi:MAG: LapA family protein [Symploca sp. SIO2C1]|nr:LapA family protein [Symploca sp. SIO2C1]